MHKTIAALLLAGVALSLPARAETLTYSWRLKGGITWAAKLAFPASGKGTLQTDQSGNVHSQLTIIGKDEPGAFYLYESLMAPDGAKTLSSRNAYAYRNDHRDERINFDTAKGLTQVHRVDNDTNETRVKKLSSPEPKDVLTSIYYLRQHADELRMPKRAEIYSGSKGYGVLYVPQPATTVNNVAVRPFRIQPVGGGDKTGEVRVWLTDDAQHVPVRIEIDQKYATLKLDLVK